MYENVLLGEVKKLNQLKDVQPIRSKAQIEEMKSSLLQFCSYRDYVLFTFGINVGLRISDILRLKVKDVRGKKRIVLKEKKTGKSSKFAIPDSLQDLLLEYTDKMDQENWLFPSRKGDKAISPTQAYRILNKAADMIGLESVGTHTMRKTFGYHYYQKTKNVYTLMEIFSHSAPSITKRYIGVRQDEIEDSLKGFSLSHFSLMFICSHFENFYTLNILVFNKAVNTFFEKNQVILYNKKEPLRFLILEILP